LTESQSLLLGANAVRRSHEKRPWGRARPVAPPPMTGQPSRTLTSGPARQASRPDRVISCFPNSRTGPGPSENRWQGGTRAIIHKLHRKRDLEKSSRQGPRPSATPSRRFPPSTSEPALGPRSGSGEVDILASEGPSGRAHFINARPSLGPAPRARRPRWRRHSRSARMPTTRSLTRRGAAAPCRATPRWSAWRAGCWVSGGAGEQGRAARRPRGRR
jgi:hypothetical protein